VAGPSDIGRPQEAIARGAGFDNTGMFLQLPNRNVTGANPGHGAPEDYTYGIRVCADTR
jgi:hypothetical protein